MAGNERSNDHMTDADETTEIPAVRTASSQPMTPEPDPIIEQVRDDNPYKIGTTTIICVIVLSLVVAIIASLHFAGNDDTPSTQETTSAPAPKPSKTVKPNANLKVDDLKGQYWSNAQKILKSRNADTSGMLVLTDDGKEPVAPANWTVENIKVDGKGKLVVHLKHAVTGSDQLGGAASEISGKIGGAWNQVKDGTMGLGHAD